MFKTPLLLFLLTLIACGPVYQTSYSYSPPPSLKSTSCINHCQTNQQDCEWQEEQRYQACEDRASADYNICESNKIYGYNYKKKRTECVANCYCSRTSCSAPNIERCTTRYNSCYVGCGGTVVSTTQCVSNCEEAEPPSTQIIRGSN